jgi:hypothetical protein
MLGNLSISLIAIRSKLKYNRSRVLTLCGPTGYKIAVWQRSCSNLLWVRKKLYPFLRLVFLAELQTYQRLQAVGKVALWGCFHSFSAILVVEHMVEPSISFGFSQGEA